MPAYSFQKRFVAKVESGEKSQTIRQVRKPATKEGQTLYLYTGLRTKAARLLRTEKCTRVSPVEIHPGEVFVDGLPLHNDERAAFAVADGFKDEAEFFQFWKDTYDLSENKPFFGQLIQWAPTSGGVA